MPVPSHEQIYDFWKSRQSAKAIREGVLQTTTLPAAVIAVQAIQQQRGTLALMIKEQEQMIVDCRRLLNAIPMPADSGVILEKWERARTVLAQKTVERTTVDFQFAEAATKVATVKAELASCQAEKAHAESGMRASEPQKLALQTLFDHMLKPALGAAVSAASGLLSNEAPAALVKLNGALPSKITQVIAIRLKTNPAVDKLRTDQASFAVTLTERARNTLHQRMSSAQQLIANAQSAISEAQATFAKMVLIGGNDPQAPMVVSADQRKKLDDLIAIPSSTSALIKLKNVENALFARDAASAALSAKSLDWLQPSEEGHVTTGPVLSAELTERTDKNTAYALTITAGGTQLADAVHILAQVPDSWSEMAAKHNALTQQLQALSKPLGQASVADAILHIEQAIQSLLDRLIVERDRADTSAAHAYVMAERRALADAYLEYTNRRGRTLTGGISA